jgi:hypothetical protein
MAERKKDLDQQMVDMGADMTTGDLTDPSLKPMARSDNPGGKLEDLSKEELLEVIRRAEELLDAKDLDEQTEMPLEEPADLGPQVKTDVVVPSEEDDDQEQALKLFFEETGVDESPKEPEVVTAKEGGSIKKNADFVKDDDEEPADPPPGATPEEVADDIPAYLSTGEYVLPANVVRYIGLKNIVAMHKGALAELQQMEDLDIIENVDENGMVEEDDDEMDYLKEPKGVVKTTLVVAKPHPSGMMAMPFQEGGTPDPDFDMDPGGTSMSDVSDPDAVDEMDPEDTGFSFGLGLEDEDPGGYAGGRRQLDPTPLEKFADFFTQPSPKTREQKPVTEKQIKQHMVNNPDLTRQQAKEELEFFNLGRTTPPQDVAKVAGLTAGLMQGLVNVFEDLGGTVTPTPEFDQRQEDRGLGPSGDVEDPLSISEKTIKTKEDETDIEKDPFAGAEYVPGVGYVFPRRKVKRVKPLKSAELNVRRGGLMG